MENHQPIQDLDESDFVSFDMFYAFSGIGRPYGTSDTYILWPSMFPCTDTSIDQLRPVGAGIARELPGSICVACSRWPPVALRGSFCLSQMGLVPSGARQRGRPLRISSTRGSRRGGFPFLILENRSPEGVYFSFWSWRQAYICFLDAGHH